MVALAAVDDVQMRLGRLLTSDETTAASGLLDEASALARGWMRCVPDPVPDEVVIVVSRMVARVLASAASMQGMSVPYGTTQMQDQAGQVSMSRSFGDGTTTSGGPWLTRADKLALRPFGCRGRVVNVSTSKEFG